MVGRAVRCGGCSTSVLWHLLSSEKEHGRCRLPSRPNLSKAPCAVVDVSCMAWPWTRRRSPPWSAIHRLRSDGAIREEPPRHGGGQEAQGTRCGVARDLRCHEQGASSQDRFGGCPSVAR